MFDAATTYVSRVVLVLMLAFALPSFADDSPVEPVKKRKAKPRKPAAAKVVPPPVPQCWPATVLTCDCWYAVRDGAKYVWEFRACTLPVPPVERLAFDEIPLPPEPSPEPLPVPLPAAAPLPEPAPFRLGVQALSMAGFSGEAERRVTGAGRVLADGPLANTWGKPARVFVDLDISALPGQTFSLAGGAEAFGRTAELRAGTYLTLAERWVGEQRITTSLVGWGSFITSIDGELADRYKRAIGFGVRLAEETTGARIVVGWTRNEVAGYQGAGQVAVFGEAPIAGTNGALVIGGDALLGLSRASVTPQRDVLRLYMGASLGAIVDAVRRR